MKLILGVIAVVVIGAVGYVMWSPSNTEELSNLNQEQEVAKQDTNTETEVAGTKSVVTDGTYTVRAEESTVSWAGKKPLIEGYVNSGRIGLKDGSITVANDTATGDFTVDMNTLTVSNTAKKPGQESKLEGHLKSGGWFDVETYPTATFKITKVTPRADSDTTFVYDVSGDLTMKDKTNPISFPATINLDEAGLLHAKASFEIDRTKWGLTFGSDTFFDNLADNAISDMVALSFNLVAAK